MDKDAALRQERQPDPYVQACWLIAVLLFALVIAIWVGDALYNKHAYREKLQENLSISVIPEEVRASVLKKQRIDSVGCAQQTHRFIEPINTQYRVITIEVRADCTISAKRLNTVVFGYARLLD